jgi:hypothetical protein
VPNLKTDCICIDIFVYGNESDMPGGSWPTGEEYLPYQPAQLFLGKITGIPIR